MTSAPTIRPAVAGDLPGALALAGPAITPALFAACLADGCAVVAEAGGVIVGLLLASPLAYDGDAPLTLWVEAVAVAPAWRRRGVATDLYRALAVRASAAGAQGVLAATDPVAAAMHRRVGFAPHREGLLLWRIGAE